MQDNKAEIGNWMQEFKDAWYSDNEIKNKREKDEAWKEVERHANTAYKYFFKHLKNNPSHVQGISKSAQPGKDFRKEFCFNFTGQAQQFDEIESWIINWFEKNVDQQGISKEGWQKELNELYYQMGEDWHLWDEEEKGAYPIQRIFDAMKKFMDQSSPSQTISK